MEVVGFVVVFGVVVGFTVVVLRVVGFRVVTKTFGFRVVDFKVVLTVLTVVSLRVVVFLSVVCAYNLEI